MEDFYRGSGEVGSIRSVSATIRNYPIFGVVTNNHFIVSD